MKRTYILFLLSIFMCTYGYTQCESIVVTGRIIDTNSSIQFYNFMVLNRTKNNGQFGNSNGTFQFVAQRGDKIAIVPKEYSEIYFTISSSIKNCQIDTTLYIVKDIQLYEEIIVYPIKPLEEIEEERKQLKKPDLRTVKGIDVLAHPITALYERFSKREKNRRKVAAMEHKDKMQQIVKELLRIYVSYDVVYLEEEQFMDFIYFLNIREDFLRKSSDYELIIFIQKRLEYYKQLHPELFRN